MNPPHVETKGIAEKQQIKILNTISLESCRETAVQKA